MFTICKNGIFMNSGLKLLSKGLRCSILSKITARMLMFHDRTAIVTYCADITLFLHAIFHRKNQISSIYMYQEVEMHLVFWCTFADLQFSRLYERTGRAIAVTTASWSALLKMLKFLIEVFKSLYLSNPWMDLVDTLPDVRYWSEVLCCTIMTHSSDFEVKVTDFENLS